MVIPPKYAVSAVVGRIKGRSASMLRKKFAWLGKVYWKENIVWSPGFFVSTIGLNEQQIGTLSSFFNIAMMVVLAPAGWLAARIGERLTIVGGFLVQFAGMVVFLISGSFASFALAWMIIGVGFALVGPSYDSLISKAVPQENRGLAYGLFWTSISFLALPAPYIGGLLWDRFTPRVPFIITAAVVLFSTIPVWFKFRVPKQDEKTGK